MGVDQPTPEQLVDRLRSPGSTNEEINQTVTEVVRDAETGGAEHMLAVSGEIAALSDRLSRERNQPGSVYDTATGRPAFHQTNIQISCRIDVEGKVFTARGAVDPFELEMRIGADGDHLERYIKYWLHHQFGKMADGDGYRFLRDRVKIVCPTDEHDLDRCRISAEGDPERLLIAVCWRGEIIRPPRIEGSLDRPTAITEQRLGSCPCRCHTRPGAEPRLRQAPGTGVFDEDRFDGR